MEYTPFVLLTDAGWICTLLLVGKLARAWLPPVQRLMIPSSMTAGLLGMALGPHGLGVIWFSDQLGSYSTILIAAVFAAIPYSEAFGSGLGRGARVMWSYSVGMYVLQWGLALLFAFGVLGVFWNLSDGFGLLLPAGWAGGFGTAAAVGSVLADGGWQEATSLGFTSATAGVMVCIVGGLTIAKWGASTGRAQTVGRFDSLPDEMRRGLVTSAEDRSAIGLATTSPSSLEPLALHLAILAVTVFAGYGISEGIAAVFPQVAVPIFAAAFVAGVAGRLLLRVTGAARYLDGATVSSLSGASTDLLVACGIASIVPAVVAAYAVPLLALLVFGTAYCVLMFRFLTPRMFSQGWLERGLFTWGWSTASIATGIALLRIVDPKGRSKTIEEFGLAYVGFAPVEIAMAIVAPVLVIHGFGWVFLATCLVTGVAVLAVPFVLGWREQPAAGDSRVAGSDSRGE